jgi:tetratricopeptide (TPR) repeat protein
MVDDTHIEIYKSTLAKAWEDGVITPTENRILSDLRRTLNISNDIHIVLETEIRKTTEDRTGIQVYKAALEQAWLDRIITQDEKAILDRIRSVLNISDEEQAEIEREIQQKINDTDSDPGNNIPTREPRMGQTAPLIRVKKPIVKEEAPRIPSIPPPKVRAPKKAPPPQEATSPPGQDAQTWLYQGELLFTNSGGNEEEIEKAIFHFNKAIELEPLNHLAWSNKGLGLKILNRLNDALMCYERAITLSPNHINSWFNKAVLLGCMNRYDEAAGCYQKVLEIDPKHELARRDLKIINQFLGQQRQHGIQ